MASILPAGIRNGIKGLDANRYATKKTVAQGMLDIALLTSNASQLKYVLQVGPRHEFYTLLVVLISISIVLQASAGVLALVISRLNDQTDDGKKKLADGLYHISVGLMTGAVFCDVISALVNVILGFSLNINLVPQQRRADIINNVSLTFKIVSITLNVVISIFYSLHVDSTMRSSMYEPLEIPI